MNVSICEKSNRAFFSKGYLVNSFVNSYQPRVIKVVHEDCSVLNEIDVNEVELFLDHTIVTIPLTEFLNKTYLTPVTSKYYVDLVATASKTHHSTSERCVYQMRIKITYGSELPDHDKVNLDIAEYLDSFNHQPESHISLLIDGKQTTFNRHQLIG